MDKVKEAIDLLSLALNEGVKDSNNDVCLSSSHCSASSTSSTCSSMCGSGSISTPNTRTSSSSSSSSSSSETSKSSRAMVACGKALDVLTHLKAMHLSEQKANFQPYQTSKCGKRLCTSGSSVETPTKSSKVSKSITWSHKFVCLAMTTATKVPTSKEKSFLSSVGLGEKVIMFPSMQVMLDEFQDILKRHYPQLEESGGFDLLKCKPNTRELEEFPYMVAYPIPWIQQQVSSGRVYIRPLQNDLRCHDDDEIVWVINIDI